MMRRLVSFMAVCGCVFLLALMLSACDEKKTNGVDADKVKMTPPVPKTISPEVKPVVAENKVPDPAPAVVSPAPAVAPEAAKPVEASPGSIEAKGREIAAKYAKSIVTVQMVVKMKSTGPGMGSEEQESRSEADGVVVAPGGLTVLALSATDPMSSMEDMMPESSGGFKMQTNLSDIKILLSDGTEIPAQVVLRDKDLDLAFIRPTEKPAQDLAFVDLTQSAEVQELDQLVAIGRLGQVAGRTHSLSLERIKAVVKRPRLLYVPESAPALGCSLFTLEGKVVGVLVLRTFRADSSGFGGMMGGMEDNILPVIVPANDINEVAKQALTATPEAPSPETPAATPEATPGSAPEAAAPPQNSVVIPK